MTETTSNRRAAEAMARVEFESLTERQQDALRQAHTSGWPRAHHSAPAPTLAVLARRKLIEGPSERGLTPWGVLVMTAGVKS